MKKRRGVLLAALALPFVIQLVPYGRAHSNPPVVKEPSWNQPATRELAVRACFDCHSNETKWPWYAHVAPMSWLVQHDVDDGRKHLNFSEWQKKYRHAKDAAEVVTKGEMPLGIYLPLHAEARLASEETKALADGLAATVER
ncbi:MAG TPA: heme-binding domain-containing protein [Polyangiaceae bacterium]|nr:heme-binding domain-containing protein [Polyangiaceae bacterium]